MTNNEKVAMEAFFNAIKIKVRDGAVVKRYGYRQAQISDVFAHLTRDEGRDLEEALAIRVWEKPDNHTTFEIKTNDGITVYAFFSDGKAKLGNKIKVEKW